MLESLLPYYERELGFLRELGKEFAARYPGTAAGLSWNGDICADPHVERMLDAFALIGARIHRRLDDAFPELTTGLLGNLFPNYLRPIPSLSIAQLVANDSLKETQTIARHTSLRSARVEGVHCQFRTVSDVQLQPIKIEHTELIWQNVGQRQWGAATLSIQLKATHGQTFDKLDLSRLRFYIDAPSPLAFRLHELLLRHVTQIQFGKDLAWLQLPATVITQYGFDQNDRLFTNESRGFPGFDLWLEYFSLPERFLFIDINDLNRHSDVREKWDNEITLKIHFNQLPDDEISHRLMREVSSETMRLGCTPIINLFRRSAVPCQVNAEQARYRVLIEASAQHGYEVHAIENVTLTTQNQNRTTVNSVPELFGEGLFERKATRLSWHCAMDSSSLRAGGNDCFLQIVETAPAEEHSVETLSIEAECCNRNLPSQLPFGGSMQRLEPKESNSPYSAYYLRRPTATLRTPFDSHLQWKLIGLLSAQQHNLLQSDAKPLKQMLHLLNSGESAVHRRHIEGIVALRVSSTVARVRGPQMTGMARGQKITIMIEPEAFAGGGAFLFGSILARFFAQRTGINQIVETELCDALSGESLAIWQPQCGDQSW